MAARTATKKQGSKKSKASTSTPKKSPVAKKKSATKAKRKASATEAKAAAKKSPVAKKSATEAEAASAAKPASEATGETTNASAEAEAAREADGRESTSDDDTAQRAHAKRLEEDLALLRDILDFHGRKLISFTYAPNERETKALARLGMMPKHSRDPQIRMRRLWRQRRRIIYAKSILSSLLLAIRDQHHQTWLRLELAQDALSKTLFNGLEKKPAILFMLDIIWEARQELSRIRGFGHLAPGWRDHDTEGGKKKGIATPTDPESLEHVRTIAAELEDDLASIDPRFARIQNDRVAELLQENTTIERFAGYLVFESSALGYEGKTREKIISNFETVHRAIEKERGERNEETIERVKERRRNKS